MERSLAEAAQEIAARLSARSERRFPVLGLRGAAEALMLRAAALEIARPIFVVTATAAEAESLAAEVALFLDEPPRADAAARRVHLFPAWEVKPFAHLSPQADTQAEQLAALFAMARSEAPIVVASCEALMMRTIPRALFESSTIRVASGDRLDIEAMVDALAGAGYQRVPHTEEPGDFSVRGGIIDVYSPLYHEPVRIELDDDLVTSIRRFDASNQRSAAAIDEATIIRTRYVPQSNIRDESIRAQVAIRAADLGMVRKEAAELLEALENGLLFPGAEFLMPYAYGAPLGSIFDYLPPNSLGWLIEPDRIIAHAARFAESVAREADIAASRPTFHPAPDSMYLRCDEFERAIASLTAVETGSIVNLVSPREGWAPPIELKSQPSLRLGANQLTGACSAISFDPLAVELRELQRAQRHAVMFVEGPNQAARLRRHLEAYDLDINASCESFGALLASEDFRPAIMQGEIASGAVVPADGIYLYSEEDLFGEVRVRRRARPVAKAALLDLDQLANDDVVVHLDHGIGRYRGLRHMKVAEIEGDFLHLEYAADGTMYLPVERINLVQRYVGADGEEPKLDRLGSGAWDKVKRRTRQAVMVMAAELLEIYAAREAMEGHAYHHPGRDFDEFCDRFEFEETPDQQAAIDDVVRDLTHAKPMDRLICGDAGFGKTEVALRAAFVAVMEGRQVAMMVPTTILAEQHWNTFCARFKDYPVRVEMVSRFRSHKENRAVVDALGAGKVDIVIGTHRLLSSDVNFPKLGLLIIDEEHRFGVADKEKIRKLRKLVPVLTMTATPIPRTLHMAMLGIRDLSIIQTPPPDRQSIRTFVAHFDDDTIRDAIVRELNRGGQVFFVHNRVENIDYMSSHLRRLVPEAKIAVAHGQMNDRQLENVMRDFVEKRINLLVCSAIIESGLDIPNANTMIINRADHFGLAQLYQLRGRVGRSRQKAYAYLLIPGEHIITREAKQRIDALRELVESENVGGGFKLAMADLEHRGAGNLLGREQSGQIAAVGFELYTEMMEAAIAELRGQPPRPDFEPELRIGIPAYIPDSYVDDEHERLSIYRRIGRAPSAEALGDIRDEMRDRFGPVPTLVENLLAAMDIRRRMRDMMILSAIIKGSQLEVRFHTDAPVDTARLVRLADTNRRTIKLTPAFQVLVNIAAGDYAAIFAQIDAVLQALAGCENLQIPASNTTRAQLN
jgi:transcription-repair coupling factor (superfamily II helicase)